jgi:hypothetical protein
MTNHWVVIMSRSVLLVLIGLLGIGVLQAQTLSEIPQVIEDQISSFRAGDEARAFSHASAGIQAQFGSPQDFMAMVRQHYAPLVSPQHVAFDEPFAVSDLRAHQIVWLIDESGQSWRAVYSLVGVDGRWRIEGVALRVAQAQSV